VSDILDAETSMAVTTPDKKDKNKSTVDNDTSALVKTGKPANNFFISFCNVKLILAWDFKLFQFVLTTKQN